MPNKRGKKIKHTCEETGKLFSKIGDPREAGKREIKMLLHIGKG
jgi:hypothetical protein